MRTESCLPLRRCVNHAFFQAVTVCKVLLLVFGMSAVMHSQATTSLRGTVTDPSGGVIPNATVLLTNDGTGIKRTAVTDEHGSYQFSSVQPGKYSLAINATGFAAHHETGLELLINTPATANVQMLIKGSNEVVTVTSSAPALNLVDASIGNSFNEKQVLQLPIDGRNVPELLSLQTGVAYTGNNREIQDETGRDRDSRSGSVNGARSDQSNVTLDGIDVNDYSKGYAFTSVLPITQDSVQEFRVTTTNYTADQGLGSGAQVALVTKSGTERFHGSAYEYLRNTATSASDYFLHQPLELKRNVFGGSVGGPVLKNRLYFFTNAEFTRRREEQSALRIVPTQSLRQGNLLYPALGGGIVTLTPAQITALDPCSLCASPGPNPAMLAYFNTYPLPNDFSQGDGLNFAGYRFRGPIRQDENVGIVRLDYRITPNGNHTLFARGSLQNFYLDDAPFLPGTPPLQKLSDHSKGTAVGYTAVLTPTMINQFSWGFTRQSAGRVGNSNQPWNTFFGFDQGITYGHNGQTPTNTFRDDFTWTKGTHSIQLGGNIGFSRNPRVSTLHSFNQGVGTTTWMAPTGFANTTSPLDPFNGSGGALPHVDPNSNNTYDLPMLALLGMVSQVQANYNFDKQGNLLPEGTPVARRYGLNWYEFYGQDTWRMKPNLTVTAGLRWSIFPPPWETNGVQVAPNINVGKQFDQNVRNMAQGLGYNAAPLISFNLGGKANGGKDFYNLEKSDFSPRVSVAYSPGAKGGVFGKLFGGPDKTVIRGGFGKVYDRAGYSVLDSFDQFGSFGLSDQLQNPCCIDGADQVARLTNLNVIPTTNQSGVPYLQPPPPSGFPQTAPAFGQAIAWGVDDSLKTPYAYTVDASIGRELPKKLSLQVAYVGRFARRQLVQRDLTQPLDLVDPKTGVDYFAAASRLSELYRANTPTSAITNTMVGSTAAYWTDMIQPLQAGGAYNQICSGGSTTVLVQAVYDIYKCFPFVDVLSLGEIDYYGALTDANNVGTTYYFNGGPGTFLNEQYSSLYGISSVGRSNYNALQITLRKQASHGVQFDFNYTWSKSIDITSAAPRIGYSGDGTKAVLGVEIPNAFSLKQNQGVSDFDTTHQINANWVVDLPFGRGQQFGGSMNKVADAFVGNWQVSGLTRWTSGFPISIGNGYNWPTNWQNPGLAQINGSVRSGVFVQPDGSVGLFPNPAAAQQAFIHPFPGQSGSRNVLRGDGYAGLDMALSKRWKLPVEGHGVQFRWEVFNVLNKAKFDVQGYSPTTPPSLAQSPQTFGNYQSLLVHARTMQFALRYEF